MKVIQYSGIWNPHMSQITSVLAQKQTLAEVYQRKKACFSQRQFWVSNASGSRCSHRENEWWLRNNAPSRDLKQSNPWQMAKKSFRMSTISDICRFMYAKYTHHRCIYDNIIIHLIHIDSCSIDYTHSFTTVLVFQPCLFSTQLTQNAAPARHSPWPWLAPNDPRQPFPHPQVRQKRLPGGNLGGDCSQHKKEGWRIIQSSTIIHPWSGFHVWFTSLLRLFDVLLVVVGCVGVEYQLHIVEIRIAAFGKITCFHGGIPLYCISHYINIVIKFHYQCNCFHPEWPPFGGALNPVEVGVSKPVFNMICLMRKGWTDYPLKWLESSPTDIINLNSAKPFCCRINVSTSSIPLAYPSNVFHSQSLPQAVVE